MSTSSRPKPHRHELQPGECLCSYCTAKCCRYFALPIDTPDCWKDFEYMRWFLMHEGATVFTEGEDWFLMVYAKCQHLGDDGLCQTYETRPDICRQYSTRNCEYEDDWVYERYLETPQQVWEYAEAVLGPRRGKDIRSRRSQPAQAPPAEAPKPPPAPLVQIAPLAAAAANGHAPQPLPVKRSVAKHRSPVAAGSRRGTLQEVETADKRG